MKKPLPVRFCAKLTTLTARRAGGDAKEVKIGSICATSIDSAVLGGACRKTGAHDGGIYSSYIVVANPYGAIMFVVQSANGIDGRETQCAQIDNIDQPRGAVDVLVIIPYNGQVLSNVIKEAKQEGIKVLAYDRMINNADIDFYISFDNEKVGEMQAQSLVDKVPQGNYFLMGGSPVDNNAKLFRAGQMKVLKPYVDDGKIKIVGDQWV
ncbi:substrate-binding domain-containing protein, partial [Klebsiella pneumoniae]|nr:substrate-binding domain-containing protein [Klebsiella pneumoniae]